MKQRVVVAFLFIGFLGFSQSYYSVDRIPSELIKGVSAVVRLDETLVTLHDFNSMTYRKKRVVTIFNKRALGVLRLSFDYDSYDTVKDYEAVLYDRDGFKMQTFKNRDFDEVSASGSSMYTDDQVKFLEFTPTSYPFTMEFTFEIKTSSTAHIPYFMPIRYSSVSVEKSKYTLINEKEIRIQTRKLNLEDYGTTVEEAPGRYFYEVENVAPIIEEYLSPHFNEFLPLVMLVPSKFQLKNTVAEIETWKDFGLWQKEKLLKGRDDIPEATKQRIAMLVANIQDPKEKTKAIYEFMQDKTRYISVQVGIGGWQPTMASEVDALNYGDCKGLTNYMYSLLKTQGIESYYTIVNAGENGRDLDEAFVALQGNHVILTVPFEDEMVFLECTSQEAPFNFLGSFTDDRKVLMVTPEGGIIGKTPTYTAEENSTKINASAVLQPNLKLTGVLNKVSAGLAYDSQYYLEHLKKQKAFAYYRELWSYLDNLSLNIIALENNKDLVQFKESLQYETDNYVSKAGGRILVNPNIFSRYSGVPNTAFDRSLPLEIRRGFSFEDEIELTLPTNYSLISVFDPILLDTAFGTYKAEVIDLGNSKILYKRSLILKSGTHPKEKFNDYVDFIKEVVKRDNSKIVLEGPS